MVDPSHNIEAEALLEHQGFLRSLARSLIADRHLAEDALQDTLAAALEHPPELRDGVRAWMSRVLRNRIATRHARESDRSVVERESREARRESVAGVDPARLEAALESQRLVAEAVRGLPEPQRTCLYLRYYEGLELARIAERLETPIDTIKSRILRGLELLRARLDGEFGSRERWAALLLPMASGSEAPGGAIPLGSKGWLSRLQYLGPFPVLAAVSLLAGGIILSVRDKPAAGIGMGAAGSAGTLVDGEAVSSPGAENRRESIGSDGEASAAIPAVATAQESEDEPLEPKTGPTHTQAVLQFSGVLHHHGGGPVPEADVYFGEHVARTDARGRFEFERKMWLISDGTKVTSTWMPLVAVKPGFQPAVVERFTDSFDLTDDRRHAFELALGGPELEIHGRVFDASGRPAKGWRVAPRDPTPAFSGQWPKGGEISIESLAAGRDVIVETDDKGRFRIGGLLARDYGLIAWDPETMMHARLEGVRAGLSDVALHVPDSALPRRIAGTVVDSHGQSVAGLGVRATLLATDDWKQFEGGRWVGGPRVRTDENGAFELVGHSSQSLMLEVNEPGVVMRPPPQVEIPAGEPSEDLNVEVGLCCKVQIEMSRAGPVSDLVAMLDGAGERLWLLLPEDDPMFPQGPIWKALPTESRASRPFTVSDQARHLVFCNWDGEELRRIPVELSSKQVNVIDW